MTIPFVLCDVFADRPFAGNPLAVFLGEVEDASMLPLAREFGWSEITFVTRRDGDLAPTVRIWTPHGELPFAGHPTIGTSVVLAAEGWLGEGPATLRLGIGNVDVEVLGVDGSGGRARMTQRAPEFGAVLAAPELARALGLDEVDLAAGLPVQIISTGLPHLLVPLADLSALERAAAQPVLRSLLDRHGLVGAYTFTADTPGSIAAARARLIGPGWEDAATGSAAGPLGAYLVRYGLHRAGALEIEQGIEMGRPSRIEVNVPSTGGEIGQVQVTGEVRMWAHGTLAGDGSPAVP